MALQGHMLNFLPFFWNVSSNGFILIASSNKRRTIAWLEAHRAEVSAHDDAESLVQIARG